MLSYFDADQIIPSPNIVLLIDTLEGKLELSHTPLNTIMSRTSSCIYRYLGYFSCGRQSLATEVVLWYTRDVDNRPSLQAERCSP